jgi:hypothetical protein
MRGLSLIGVLVVLALVAWLQLGSVGRQAPASGSDTTPLRDLPRETGEQIESSLEQQRQRLEDAIE